MQAIESVKRRIALRPVWCVHRIQVVMEGKRRALWHWQTGATSYRRVFCMWAATEYSAKSHGTPCHPHSRTRSPSLVAHLELIDERGRYNLLGGDGSVL
jgi:hypothetical protein